MSRNNEAIDASREEAPNLLVTAGQISIEGSQINNLTQIENVAQLNVQGRIDNTTVQNMNVQGETSISNARIQNLTVNETHQHQHHQNVTVNETHQHQHQHHQNVTVNETHQHQHHQNVTVNETHQHQHQHQHLHEHQHQHQHLHQSLTVNQHQHQHQHTYNVQQVARPPFDEEAFTKYLKSLELFYGHMDGSRIFATPNMLRYIPSLVKTSYDGRMRTMGAKRYTDLFDLFPNGIPMKNLIGLVGEPGSGKTVLLKLMQLMFINSGYFPFPIQFKAVDGKGEKNFAHFVSTAYPGFPIEDLNGFGEWLTKNSLRIVFLCDGLDEASIDMSANVLAVNIQDCASAQTWLASLFSRKIMPDSMVVFTSRPASIFKLPISQRPDMMYSLDGLDSASMESVVNIYNKENSSEIITLINTKASKENNFLRSPFAVSLIATSYNTSSNDNIHADITLTSLYVNALEQRRRSVHNRRTCNESAQENKHVQDLVDNFYLNRFMANRLEAFNAAELKEFGLSAEQLENHSFVNVYCKQNAHFIEDEDTMIEPSHLSVTEFHSARALIKRKNIEEFKEAVDKLFVMEDQDRKTLIRRFISGLITNRDSDAKKQEIFLEKLINDLKNFMSGEIARKYKGDKYTQAVKLQCHLLNDIAELQEEVLQFVHKNFVSDSNLLLNVKVQDVALLNGVTNFMNKIDPQLNTLVIHLNDELHADDVSQLINAILSLSRNIGEMRIYYTRYFDIDVMKKLVGKVDSKLTLHYDNEVDASKIDQLKTALQYEMDIPQSKRMFVEVDHLDHRELIRHHSYASMTSPLILPSHFGGNEKTMNLSQQLPAKYEDEINGKSFDFVISQVHEIKNLSRVIALNSNLVIRILYIYHPAQIDMNLVKMFCGNLHQLENKVDDFRMFNIDEAVFGFDEIPRLMKQVKTSLILYFINTISETSKDELEQQLDFVHKSATPGLYVLVNFRNTSIRLLTSPSSSSSHKCIIS